MNLKLKGKTAIVTGAGAGIGKACAEALYREGVNLIIAARNAEKLELAAQEIRTSTNEDHAKIVAVAADLSDSASAEKLIETAIENFGAIDILVNNAGAAQPGEFQALPDEAFSAAWELKFLGYVRMIRAVLPQMIEQRDGRIVNIVGTAARVPTAKFLTGSTVNAALLNFTRGIVKDLAKNNIRINAISPGLTNTNRARMLIESNARAQNVTNEGAEAQMLAAIPIGRAVEPDEVADLMLFLVSDRAAAITGTEVIIDGGQSPSV